MQAHRLKDLAANDWPSSRQLNDEWRRKRQGSQETNYDQKMAKPSLAHTHRVHGEKGLARIEQRARHQMAQSRSSPRGIPSLAPLGVPRWPSVPLGCHRACVSRASVMTYRLHQGLAKIRAVRMAVLLHERFQSSAFTNTIKNNRQ